MSKTEDKETTEDEKKKKEEEQEKINKALRQKYEREMQIYEEQSNEILDGVRKVGVSVDTRGGKKKRPESISDIHILFSRQKPEFVKEGVDTSEELEKELEGNSDEKNKEEEKKKNDEDKTSSS